MPSKRHIELQNMIRTWIGNRSIKMAAISECNIVGYVADFVAITRMNDAPHERYCRFSGLKARSMSHVWQGKGLPLKDIIRGDIDRHYVCVFEVKVSRADFLNTFSGKESPHAKARMEKVGTAHWVVAEKGVCEPNELPEHWGLLTPYGGGLSEKKMPKLNILSEEQIHSMGFDMLWLRMNYRLSYYDQIAGMSEKVQSIRDAILRKDVTKKELLSLSEDAIKSCKGFVV